MAAVYFALLADESQERPHRPPPQAGTNQPVFRHRRRNTG
jgi:hypothetical protein